MGGNQSPNGLELLENLVGGNGHQIGVKMAQLDGESWSWRLDDVDGELVLNVLCSGRAMKMFPMALTPEEVARWREHGGSSIKPLIDEIRDHPERFEDRRWGGERISAQEFDSTIFRSSARGNSCLTVGVGLVALVMGLFLVAGLLGILDDGSDFSTPLMQVIGWSMSLLATITGVAMISVGPLVRRRIERLERLLREDPSQIVEAKRMVVNGRGVTTTGGPHSRGQHQVHVQSANKKFWLLNVPPDRATEILKIIARCSPEARVEGIE